MNPSRFRPRLAALLLPAVVLLAAPQAPPPPPPDAMPPGPFEDEAYQGEAPERYAMVRAVEGEVHIRKGDLDELLGRGTPISEGDVVESRGRGVLQLGDGTRVAFGGATRFTIGALFTDQKGEKQVLLRLDYGRLRVQLGGQSGTRLRVDTPSGTATCFDRGAFGIEAERDRLVRLKVQSGRVAFNNERDEARIGAGERLTVYSPQDGLDRVRAYNTYDGGDDFERWSDRAMTVPRGESWDRVPPELRYYADELDGHGRWIHTDEFGDVWQPAGVAEDWRPYSEGRWAPYAGGMTWVSEEPWAYVAYHHGRWHWSVGFGWCWIPGVYYSPAWVAWHNTPGYCGWAPLGYYNTPAHFGYGAWGGGYAWNVVSINLIGAPRFNRHSYADVQIIRTFNAAPAGRGLQAPWQRTPLIVTHAEFRNPGQFQAAFRPEVHRERMVVYERQAASTGRVIYRRDPVLPMPVDRRPQGGEPIRRPFEDRGRGPGANRPADPRLRVEERRPDTVPVPRERTPDPRPRVEERRPDTVPVPRERTPDPRPRVEERRPDTVPVPRERTPDPRPRVEERRPDTVPVPRERTPDPRPRVEERRPDTVPVPRERTPDPRPRVEERRPDTVPVPRERTPDPRPRVEERRPEAPKPAEARPAPPREKPHEEKRHEDKKN